MNRHEGGMGQRAWQWPLIATGNVWRVV